jgi:pSer/pThr/pTyr-binding forkhead associated (FHA) protein
MPFLTITSADGQETTHEISGDSISVGRNDDNTLHVDDASLSGSHAEFRANDAGGYSVADLGSTNGTSVGGEQIAESALNDGDRVAFGSIEGVYTLALPSEVREDEPPAEDTGDFPESESLAAEVGDTSYRPDDFNSISPFPKRTKAKDPIAKVFLAVAGVSIIVSVLAAVCAVMMKAS